MLNPVGVDSAVDAEGALCLARCENFLLLLVWAVCRLVTRLATLVTLTRKGGSSNSGVGFGCVEGGQEGRILGREALDVHVRSHELVVVDVI